MAEFPEFSLTPEAAWERVAAIRVADYARTRNHLDGAVTRLSPYLTHGLLYVPEVVAALRERHPEADIGKLVQELAWREYFQHVQRHLGERIFADIHAGPTRPQWAALPADIREGRTGVPVIDQSVRELYRTGYLHNHARMWVASYVVHVRKVAWIAGANWMVRHLLDGDLASNHLSWQWCAGTFSTKPYLFNAENVARFAPVWASPGTVVDRSYEALAQWAAGPNAGGPEPGQHSAVPEPDLHSAPPLSLPDSLPAFEGHISLVHPWDLGERAREGRSVGVLHLPFHQRFPWSAARWDFVLSRMNELCECVWAGDLHTLLSSHSRCEYSARLTLNPGYRQAFEAADHAGRLRLHAPPRFTADPDNLQPSFSAYWRKVGPPITSRRA